MIKLLVIGLFVDSVVLCGSSQAIHGFRETERVSWGKACEEIIRRVRSAAFAEGSPLLGPIHVLDLDKDGFIKPHIDSVKVVFIDQLMFSGPLLFISHL